MKIVVLSILLFIGLWAESPALFGKIVNVAKNDTLNVRKKANYKAKKVAEIPPDWFVGIEKCKTVKSSVWCRVYPLVQEWSDHFGDENDIGWVNARYLKFTNRGFVLINGKRNCDYALSCNKGKCEVVYDVIVDDENALKGLQTKWIERKYLKGANHFGASPENQDGFCSPWYIEDYIAKQNIKRLSAYHSGSAYDTAIMVTQSLKEAVVGNELQSYIHPVKGVVVTWNVLFGGKEDKVFTREDISGMRYYDKDKIHWGHTYGKGDAVIMNLANHLKMFARPIRDITKVEKLKELKRFKGSDSSQRVGYEVFWINEASETKEYDYLGLVVLLEQYQGKWYVVGLLRDRWTI